MVSVRAGEVGYARVEGAVRWAGPRPVALGVEVGTERARALYLRHGFVERAPGTLVRVPA
ncbi:hypothetical protein ACRAKI_30620 [Saccharothrix isguenensis]